MNIANFSPGVGAVDTTPNPNPPIPATQPSNLGNQIATKISQARQTYPGQDDQVLQAFVRDNQKTLPTVVQKVQGLMSSDRAMRNNNPTAMTSDVAASLGLKHGIDYTDGDPFSTSSGSQIHTAKLLGDPIQTTIKAFDTAAQNGTPIFQTDSGKPRWSYINLTNDQWKNLTPQQKADTIAHMKTSGEGSKGYSATQILNSLVQDNQAPNPQATPASTSDNQIVNDNPFSGIGNALKNTANAVFEPESKMIASATQAIKATPQIFQQAMNTDYSKGFTKLQPGELANEPAMQTMSEPVLGQKTMAGSSIDENLGSAATAGTQALALEAPDIISAIKDKGLIRAITDSKLGSLGKAAWKHKVTAGIMYELATNPKGTINTIGKLIDLIKAP